MNLNIKDKIVYIPIPVKRDKINEYTLNMVKLLQDKYNVLADMAEPTDILQMLQTKAVFLNWVETELNRKMKVQLLLYKVFGTKVIWVFHNKYPHDTKEKNEIASNMNWLAKHSSIIILHSKSSRKYIPEKIKNQKKAVYLPHILYPPEKDNINTGIARKKYHISESEFVFTIFGFIRPYKNIEGAITAFQKLKLSNAKLLIAGKPIDNAYAKKIKFMCRENENIILDLQYIPNVMLDDIIDISDVIVLPYKDGSSMNSGVMIQAFSKGKTVIAPDICMARDMACNRFFYLYRKSLEKVMEKAYKNGKSINEKMGKCAKDYIYENNNDTIVKEKLYKILQ